MSASTLYPIIRMEHHSISSLLKDQPDRSLETIVTHFEDIPDVKGEYGIPLELVVLAFIIDGVIYTGLCILDLPGEFESADAKEEAINKFKYEVRKVWKEASTLPLRFSAPGSDAQFSFPVVRPVEVKKESAGE